MIEIKFLAGILLEVLDIMMRILLMNQSRTIKTHQTLNKTRSKNMKLKTWPAPAQPETSQQKPLSRKPSLLYSANWGQEQTQTLKQARVGAQVFNNSKKLFKKICSLRKDREIWKKEFYVLCILSGKRIHHI